MQSLVQIACCFKLSLDKTEVNERAVYKDDGNIDNFEMGFFSWFIFFVQVKHITESLIFIIKISKLINLSAIFFNHPVFWKNKPQIRLV